jgi:hypothetical protein
VPTQSSARPVTPGGRAIPTDQPYPPHGTPGDPAPDGFITFGHLPATWRVDVTDTDYRLELGGQPRFTHCAIARLLAQSSRRGRWRAVGVAVTSDSGPLAAVSDLLAALDAGLLPALPGDLDALARIRDTGREG